MAKSKTIVLILAACGGLGILMIGSCAGLLFLGFRNTDAAVSPRIDGMFSAIAKDCRSEDRFDTVRHFYASVSGKELRARA